MKVASAICHNSYVEVISRFAVLTMINVFSATKPKSDAELDPKRGSSQHGFQMAPDGRLIIREDKGEDEPAKKGQINNI